MENAIFKSIPNYEYNRDGVYALFNGEGKFVTNDAKVIEALDKAKPFVSKETHDTQTQKRKPKPKPKK